MKNYVKYLGNLIDKNLSWKTHIDNKATKLRKTVSLIAKLRFWFDSIYGERRHKNTFNKNLFA